MPKVSTRGKLGEGFALRSIAAVSRGHSANCSSGNVLTVFEGRSVY
jgi:hypothetical protein